MKRICIFFLFLILGSFSMASSSDFDFRRTRWGMSQTQVIESEEIKPIGSDENAIIYQTRLLERPINLIYNFIDNELYSASYALMDAHTNYNLYIADYKEFCAALTGKYGKPFFNQKRWLSDLYKNDPQFHGMAVAIGNLTYLSQWETEETKIQCGLNGDKMKIMCVIIYESKALKPIVEARHARKTDDDL